MALAYLGVAGGLVGDHGRRIEQPGGHPQGPGSAAANLIGVKLRLDLPGATHQRHNGRGCARRQGPGDAVRLQS